MNFFHSRPLIVLHGCQPAAVDLAARIGLSSSELALPAAVTDEEAASDHRPLLLIGRDNRRLPAGLVYAAPPPGCGAVTKIGDAAVLLWGADAAGEALACRWAAACWSGVMERDEYIITAESLAAPPGEAGGTVRRDGWPVVHPFRCLSQAFSVEGLLSSRDGLFPDDVSVRFDLSPALSPATFVRVLDLAARVGAESTGLRFPLGDGSGPVVRVGLDEEDGWIRLTDNGLSVGAGPSLDATLAYLAGVFPRLPGDAGWLQRDVTAVKDLLARRPPYSPQVVLDERWQGEGEESRLLALWRNELLPQVAAVSEKSGWQVTVTMSEPAEIRQEVAAAIADSLAAAGFRAPRLVVRPAYKQGYYWLTAEVLPELLALQPDRVVIGWRPFAEPGVRDLPIRWLQEVYPADEVLAVRLGAPAELTELPPDAAEALAARAYRGGELVFSAGMTPASRRRPYLDNDPAAGAACSPTGWVEVAHPREGRLVSRHFPTDLELFWDWYSGDVLARIEGLTGCEEPLFGTLTVEYSGSEPEERLAVGQELASPLEALHEDIYFTTLDRFASLGKLRRGEPFAAPGAILPWLRATSGLPPRGRVSLTKRGERETAAVHITGIHIGGKVATGQGVMACPPFDLPPARAAGAGPIYLEELAGRLAALGTADSAVRVRVASRSVGGDPIFAVELPAAGRRLYGAGASLRHPTLLINARHHANEVASTTAVLRLVEELDRLPELREKLNIVVVPLENADGARIHEQMQRDNPEWKLHAARYNQDGCEFYGEYFNHDTPYTEAMALSRLWRQWLPDMVLDAHGVPSHEWVQCFSGYGSPPRFPMSFWLPNALIYGILYEPREFAGNVAAGRDFAGALAEAFRADDDIRRLNEVWLGRYRRYGHDNLPGRFPLELLDGTICYRQDAAERKISFSWRQPGVTAVHCVTEVADETAQGDYLGLCAKAHTVAMLTAAEWLAGKPAAVHEGIEAAGGQIRRWRARRRIQETAAKEAGR